MKFSINHFYLLTYVTSVSSYFVSIFFFLYIFFFLQNSWFVQHESMGMYSRIWWQKIHLWCLWRLCWCLRWGCRLHPQLSSRGLKGEEFQTSHGYANPQHHCWDLILLALENNATTTKSGALPKEKKRISWWTWFVISIGIFFLLCFVLAIRYLSLAIFITLQYRICVYNGIMITRMFTTKTNSLW